MKELDIIKQIEKELNCSLKQVDKIEWNTRGYVLNNKRQIVKLGLYNCGIKNLNGDILKQLKYLTYLNLKQNNIFDIDIFLSLNNLNFLDLSNNKISDLEKIINLINSIENNCTIFLNNNIFKNFRVTIDKDGQKSIFLSNNQISDISWLTKINKIISLDLSNNNISDIKILQNISELKYLNLANNFIKNISSLKKLTNLTYLNLTNNNINEINELKELTNLKHLRIRKNQIENITPLQNLKRIEILKLRDNKIKDINPIKNLTTLIELDIEKNQITDISPLRNLKKLTSLKLRNNQITDISPLTELTNLIEVKLRNNKIKDITPLQNLIKISDLDLEGNQIIDISPLKKLIKLNRLNLKNNQIKILPEWITEFEMDINLDGDKGILLGGNPIEIPPLEIVKKGKGAIREWFEQQKKYGKTKFYEAKIIIIGEGGAGKTTLQRLLFNENIKVPDYKQASTHGIQIANNRKFPHPQKKNIEINTHIWDFGGQYIQYNLHHYFLTPNALYILVHDLREDKTKFTYWFQAINFFAQKGTPIIVLKNPKDAAQNDIDISRYKQDFPDIAPNITEIEINLKEINSSYKKRWLAFINEIIPNQLIKLNTVGQEGIKVWQEIKKEFNNISEPYLQFEEVMKIAKEKGMKEEEDVTFMLNYFHLVGTIVFYNNDNLLRNYVFINPNWITTHIYDAISQDFNQNGIFDKTKIEKYWSKKGLTRTARSILLDLMKKDGVDVAYPLPNNKLAVPQLFKDIAPKYKEVSGENIIRIKYNFGNFMPVGILSRFIVRMYEYIEKDADGKDLAWRSGVVLQRYGSRAIVVEHVNVNEISITVGGGDAARLRDAILTTFEKIFDHFPNKPQPWIPCNCSECRVSDKPYYFPYKVLVKALEKGKKVQCQNSFEYINPSELAYGIKTIIEKRIEYQAKNIINIHGSDNIVNQDSNYSEIKLKKK